MKTFTAVLLFSVILGCKIEVDAGSFNLTGFFDPGVSFVRGRSLQQKYQARKSEDDEANSDWPHPSHINNFVRPTSFNDPIPDETGSNDNKRSQAHQHRSRHRASRH